MLSLIMTGKAPTEGHHAKCDWFEVGGRFEGMLHLKQPRKERFLSAVLRVQSAEWLGAQEPDFRVDLVASKANG